MTLREMMEENLVKATTAAFLFMYKACNAEQEEDIEYFYSRSSDISLDDILDKNYNDDAISKEIADIIIDNAEFIYYNNIYKFRNRIELDKDDYPVVINKIDEIIDFIKNNSKENEIIKNACIYAFKNFKDRLYYIDYIVDKSYPDDLSGYYLSLNQKGSRLKLR